MKALARTLRRWLDLPEPVDERAMFRAHRVLSAMRGGRHTMLWASETGREFRVIVDGHTRNQAPTLEGLLAAEGLDGPTVAFVVNGESVGPK